MITVKDYHSAMEVISTTEVDLIVADIVLGRHTGIGILQEVKERGLSCPVVMITGQPSIETEKESVRLGAFRYLTKPVRKDTLLSVTGMALQHKAHGDEKA